MAFGRKMLLGEKKLLGEKLLGEKLLGEKNFWKKKTFRRKKLLKEKKPSLHNNLFNEKIFH